MKGMVVEDIQEFEELLSIFKGRETDQFRPEIIFIDSSFPEFEGKKAAFHFKENYPSSYVAPLILLYSGKMKNEYRENHTNAWIPIPNNEVELIEIFDQSLDFWLNVARLPFPTVMSTEKIKLSLDDFKKIQIASQLAIGLVLHDIKYPLRELIQIEKELKPRKKKKSPTAKSIEEVKNLVEILKGFLSIEAGSGFILDLYFIIRNISKQFPHINIEFDDRFKKDKTIIFPSDVVQGICKELITNASKHSPVPLKVKIIAGIRGNFLTMEFHDNGGGITTSTSPLPLDLLDINPSGLKIIHKICSSLGGMLLFAKSEVYEGSKIIVNLPAIKSL